MLATSLGMTRLTARVEGYAVLNVVMGVIWIFLTWMVIREYKKRKAAVEPSPAP